MPSSLPPPHIGDPFVPMPAPVPVVSPPSVERPSRWPIKRTGPIRHTGLVWAGAIVVTAWLAGLLGVYVGARLEADDARSTYQVSTQAPVVGGARGPALDKRIDVAA